MSDNNEPSEPGGEITSWAGARDRIIRFARNIFKFERTIDRLVDNQAKQQKLLNDLHNRVQRIEAQQEIISRLLERDRKD